MSARRWSNVSYLDAIRPDTGWRSEYAFLASYSADLVALVAALLALAGLDDDRGSGSKVDFANTVDLLADRVRLIAQAGRLVAPAKTPKILTILDRYVREVNSYEKVASWHPKAALVKHVDDGKNSQWRLWIGSRNLTRDLSWDVGLSLTGNIGQSGKAIEGIPELGHTLAEYAELPRISAAKVRSELRQVRWEPPQGCTIHSLQLFEKESGRGLPSPPPKLQKLVVVSPFLDGTVVGQLGKWGDDRTHRILLSSRPELAKLAILANKPLAGFRDLLFLDAPVYAEDAAGESSGSDDPASQDEEPEPRGLHAKIIYAEGGGKRLIWTGSANATQRGWHGPNAEIIASLEVARDVVAGLDDFVKAATTIKPEEIGDPVEPDQDKEQLDDARIQVVDSWRVTQKQDVDGNLLASDTDPNPHDPAITLSIGLLGATLVPWPRSATTVRLPKVAPGEVTEFVCCRLTLGEISVSWLQRAPLDPPPGEERDRQALARYLDPRTFLLWIRSLLTGEASGEGSGDWDEEDKPKQPKKSPRAAPTWWAPTIEEVLKAWTREPDSLILIDKKVQHYLKLYQDQTDTVQTEEERKVVEIFHNTWNILRKVLVAEAK
jgi:hypothetical protein